MTKNNQPLVSVIMPVYDAGEFLVEAIESIRNQTFRNWELIAVDDASRDDSFKILKGYAKKDKRIKVYGNKKNRGVAASANLALEKAKGEYIARMDADDVALPTRLEKQVSYLQKTKDVIAVGGQCRVIDKDGKTIGKKTFPKDDQDVRKMIFHNIPVQQPSIMVNKNLLPNDFKWYNDSFTVAEEVELLFKLFQYGKVCNLGSTILLYRVHGGNVSLIDPKKTFYSTFKTRVKAIKKYNYRPTFEGVVVSIVQFAVITILPNKAIYPVYATLRGMKRYGATLSLPRYFVAKVRLAKVFS